MKPVAIDLFCGRGGWTRGLQDAGYDVIGIDIKFFADYPGTFFECDVMKLRAIDFYDAHLIVASPPCQQFSRWDWDLAFRARVKHPDMALVKAARRIGFESGVPFVLENVRGLERWIGSAGAHYGPFYLWGDVPALMPDFGPRRPYKMRHRSPSRRAEIPRELARHIGLMFYPSPPGAANFPVGPASEIALSGERQEARVL